MIVSLIIAESSSPEIEVRQPVISLSAFTATNLLCDPGSTIDNINDYFKEGYMGVGLASNLMPLSVLKDKNWDLGVSYVQKYVSRVKRRV